MEELIKKEFEKKAVKSPNYLHNGKIIGNSKATWREYGEPHVLLVDPNGWSIVCKPEDFRKAFSLKNDWTDKFVRVPGPFTPLNMP